MDKPRFNFPVAASMLGVAALMVGTIAAIDFTVTGTPGAREQARAEWQQAVDALSERAWDGAERVHEPVVHVSCPQAGLLAIVEITPDLWMATVSGLAELSPTVSDDGATLPEIHDKTELTLACASALEFLVPVTPATPLEG